MFAPMVKTALPPKDSKILIRLDTKLKDQIVKAATKRGQTVSDFIRVTLIERMSRPA